MDRIVLDGLDYVMQSLVAGRKGIPYLELSLAKNEGREHPIDLSWGVDPGWGEHYQSEGSRMASISLFDLFASEGFSLNPDKVKRIIQDWALELLDDYEPIYDDSPAEERRYRDFLRDFD